MSHKKIAMWSLIMIVIFGVTVVVYPLIFSPQTPGTLNAEPIPGATNLPALGK